MRSKFFILALTLCIFFVQSFSLIAENGNHVKQSNVRKVKDIVIYEDSLYYAAFPSIIKNGEKDFIVAFRRAPERRIFGEKTYSHIDMNSYLVMLRSSNGEVWGGEPALMYAHPFGGSQDPCMLALKDGTILCTSYGWQYIDSSGQSNLKKPFKGGKGRTAVFLGGYLVRSSDNGKTWQGPIYPPHVDAEINFGAFGEPLPAYNRGALYEGKGGRIFWVVAVNDSVPVRKTSNHLLISDDKGLTWQYSGVVASDDKVTFNEASVYETPKGDLVAFIRTANYEDQACISRSTDGGKTFQWESMGFKGHPCHALRLPDNRVLLTYGYRHEPYGIRARILNAECTDYATAPEIIIRDDGGSVDIGYTWSVLLDNNRVLVVYYFNKKDGTRHIAGTIMEIA